MKKIAVLFFLLTFASSFFSQTRKSESDIDKKVLSYLENNNSKWASHHIPESDGKAFYDMIIKNNYKSAVEIGTAEGYSAIWIAWALSKTGGKLITIEIDEESYKKALSNFKEAGLSDYIDARLADAHKLVRNLKSPFDFILMDADISTDYLNILVPKMLKGGVYITHGVRNENSDYSRYLKGLKELETNFRAGGGYCISIKK